LAEDDLKLFPEFRVISPLPLHFDDFPRSGINDIPNDRYQLSSPINLDLCYGVAVFFVDIGDSFNLAVEVGEIIG
jgi:hypothetical protein